MGLNLSIHLENVHFFHGVRRPEIFLEFSLPALFKVYFQYQY